MKNKLTFWLDDSLIKQAKEYARKKGTSVSQLVADYFSDLDEEIDSSEKFSPITSSFKGF